MGSDVTFCVKFRNASSTVAGFSPFLDAVFPAGGKDYDTASGPCDGATFVSARVTSTTPPVPLFPETPISAAVPCGSAGPSIQHPYAGSGVPPVVVPANASRAGQLVVLPLPFGSYEPDHPETIIEFTVRIHTFADSGFTLPVRVRGGFRYGANAIDDPLNLSDQPRVNPPGPISGWPTQNLVPFAVAVRKQFPFADDETVTGPNFEKNYDITVDVAPNQTVTNLQVRDCLPPGGVWNPLVPSTPPATATFSGNCLTLRWPTLTGSNNLPTASASPRFFINNAPLINPQVGCSATFSNTATIIGGSWLPTDSRDLVPLPVLSGSSGVKITKKALAVQRSALVTTPQGAIPGANIHNTIRFQVNDYLRFGGIVITDTLSAGQQPNLLSATFTVKDRFGSSGPFPFPAAFIHITNSVTSSYTCPAPADPCRPPAVASTGALPGGMQIQFDVSQAMIARTPLLPASQRNGILTGGRVGLPSVGAEGVITFDAVVRDTFSPSIQDDGFVDKDDPLLATALITAKQYQNTPVLNPPPTGAGCKDSGTSCLSVPSDKIFKEVVAINGVWQSTIPNQIGGPNLTRGNRVTFRLRKIIPSGDAENVTIRDFYALPFFAVPPMSITQCPSSPTFSPLLGGEACWRNAPNPVTAQPASPADNSITYTLGTFNDPLNQPRTIEILSTVEVTNDPYADGLLSTNVAQECETNSYGPPPFCQTAIAQIKVQEPSLKIGKRVLCAPDCGKQACSTGCPRSISYAVTSSTLPGLGASTVQADAGDRITFVAWIENIGTGPFGAYDIVVKDLLGSVPGAMDISSVCVTNGTGASIPYILRASSTTGWEIELVDSSTGSLAPFPSTTGANIGLIVFDVVLNPAPSVTAAGQCDPNTAILEQYSNRENGTNFVTSGFPTNVTSTASVCVGPRNLQKLIAATSEAHTTGADVTIGEIVRYDVSFDAPEGMLPVMTLTDSLPAGLEMIGTAVVTSTNFTNPPSLSIVKQGSSLSQLQFQIPSFTNLDSDPDCEKIHIGLNALVTNSVNNHQPGTKSNGCSLQVGTMTINSPQVVVTIVEPNVQITKTATLSGTTATYVVTVTNVSAVTAFDVVLSDTQPACLQGLTVTAPPLFAGGNVSALPIGNLAPNQSVSVTYTATTTCSRCADLENTATATWTSLPGTGTFGNPTTDNTPGTSGAPDGERNGSGTGENRYIATATASLCGTVCGTKFFDFNSNGVRDPGDFVLSGWTITALQGSNTIATTTTTVGGTYCFTLPFGAYTICEQQQPSWTQTLPAANGCYNVQVGAGTLSGNDFGNRSCVGDLCVIKKDDQGALLPGWVIYGVPIGISSYPIITGTTDQSGRVCFRPPGPMSYDIFEVPQNGWAQTLPTSHSVTVQITCVPQGTSPSTVVFVNRNVCAGIPCLGGTHCIAQNGQGVCITDPLISPCATTRCRFPFSCTVVNGNAICTP
ncbi:MAG: hypothetical protein AABO58_00640 [Acidobacteriota bacterium]